MIYYEWDAESVDEFGDVQDHFTGNKLSEVIDFKAKDGLKVEIVLIRNTIESREDSVEDRAWAYLENGKLPDLFDDGEHKVPVRFHQEVSRLLG